MTSLGRMSRGRLSVGVAIIVAALAVAMIGFSVWELRADAVAIATGHVSDMATILADDVEDAANTIDLSLREAVEIASAATQGGPITDQNAEIIEGSLTSHRFAVGRADLIAVADAGGKIVAATYDRIDPSASIADREFFTRLRDDSSVGLLVSRPLVARSTGAWTIVFSRRIAAADGRFLGIAFIGVEPAKLFRTHPEMTGRGAVSFSLFHHDGTIAMREPDGDRWVGTRIARDAKWWDVVARGGGLFWSPGVLDGYAKYVAVRPVAGYPLVVNVAVTEQAALAPWRNRATTIVGGGVIGIALIFGLLFLQLRLTDRLARSRIRDWMRGKRLAASESELLNTRNRLGLILDHISQGMAMFDANEKLVFSNRCF
ncbi:MAG: hypothetical protein JO234_15370, partial [Hyphomicrobiales bacterium]|nr:hypothetical protein [Hyphomicrobiales bacterium]